MHLIYRSKKQTLPVVHDSKLAPYMASVVHQQSPTTQAVGRKKSVELILEKHIGTYAPGIQALVCYKPQRKTMYRASKTKKGDSGFLKVTGRADHS
jgi:hypothetical protein